MQIDRVLTCFSDSEDSDEDLMNEFSDSGDDMGDLNDEKLDKAFKKMNADVSLDSIQIEIDEQTVYEDKKRQKMLDEMPEETKAQINQMD